MDNDNGKDSELLQEIRDKFKRLEELEKRLALIRKLKELKK